MKPSKPLVFYVIAFYAGCISYIAFSDNGLLGAVIAASFLVITFLTIDKKFSIIIICFFAAGYLAITSYYNNVSIKSIETIRLEKNKDFYYVGKIKGRNVFIKGDLENLQQGDRILAQGRFEKQIDYSRGAIGTFYVEQYKLYKADALSRLQGVKRSSYTQFEKYLGKEKAAMVMSLCFGEIGYLSEEQNYDFQELGVVHAISVSGFHMAIIYKILESLAGFEVSMAVSFVYMIFTGAQPATIRAFLMILVLKLSKKVFRNYDSLSALSLSALVILASRPYYVLDVGFMLSYLSTIGIILYYNKIRRALFKLPAIINESLSLTLSAQVFSMAYSGMVFNNISYGFIIGNIILLPLYTAVVVVGNLALLLMKADYIFSFICYVLNIIILAVEGAAYLLLKLTPPVSEISYAESLAVLILAASFMLTIKGYNKFKYVPVFVLGVLLLQNYYFFPRIDYINLGGRDGVIISYKSERILIHNLMEELTPSAAAKFKRVISNPGKDLVFGLGKSYRIRMLEIKDHDRQSISLEVEAGHSKTIITRNTQDFMDMDLKKYDIIRLPRQEYYPFKGKITSKTPNRSYAVIFKKVYALQKE
jgi:competence protein ComEC